MFSKAAWFYLFVLLLLCTLGPGESKGFVSWVNGERFADLSSTMPYLAKLERPQGKIPENVGPAPDAGSQRSPIGPPAKAPQSKEQLGPATSEEVAKLKNQIIEVQNRGKLGFRKIVSCSAVERFGVYSPLQSHAPVSRLFLYFEPANYSTMVTKDRYIIDCSVDLFLFNEAGKPVAGKKGILKIKRISRSPVLDLYYKIRIDLKKPLKGDIVIKTVLHDHIKNASASASYRINIKSDKKKSLEGV